VAEITTTFWDMGGVILTNAWDRAARQRAVAKFGLDWDDFEDRHELLLHAFETGETTLENYLDRVVFYRKRAFSRDDFKCFMFEQSQAAPEGLAVLGRAAAAGRYLIAALNNESLELNQYRIERFGLRKLALSITQRAAEECVFIDDRALNLECARELGMHTIQFQSAAQLERELRNLGVALENQPREEKEITR
jgi:putative hydrolase of the HAD superfamily